jgi:hypothetical protein
MLVKDAWFRGGWGVREKVSVIEMVFTPVGRVKNPPSTGTGEPLTEVRLVEIPFAVVVLTT